ncbi:MAG: hypothetical protein JWO38_7671, partial [Gemmataceae bacterium]|nr:hypothetical protein [Gemmataceae bacterium]
MSLLIDRRQVGVLGIQQAGKTTLITSLIHHLRDHHPADFPLGDGSWRVKFVSALENENGIPRFEFRKHRDQLQNRRWPSKTRAVSEYRCRLEFSGGPLPYRLENALGLTELSLVDIPGERMADLGMLGTAYDRWSDLVLEFLDGQYEYQVESRGFVEMLEGGRPLTAAAVVAEYKRTLARLVFKHVPLITPSTLLVTADGQYVPTEIRRARDPAALARAHLTGLEPGCEFAPLSEAARTANPAVATEFEGHYTRYRDELVRPLAATLFACDQLVVLIDPTTLLAGGVGVYNRCLQILDQVLKCLAPGRTDWTTGTDAVLRFLTGGRARLTDLFSVPSVTRIAVVVGQADKVHHDDQDKLGRLARLMIEPRIEDVLAGKPMRVEYFVCSAVFSSAS